MNAYLTSFRCPLRAAKAMLAAVVVVLVVAAPAQAARAAADLNPGVSPPNARPYGKTYAQWNDAWVQWILSIPVDAVHPELYPLFDRTGAACATNQSGHVWFLAGTLTGSDPVVRNNCVVPAGTSLFLPVFNYWIDTTPPALGTTYDELIAIIRPLVDAATGMAVSVDAQQIQNLRDSRSTSTNLFNETLPADNLYNYFGASVPAGTYQGVADGYYLMLDPLSVGQHSIHIVAPGLDVTYNLTVAPGR